MKKNFKFENAGGITSTDRGIFDRAPISRAVLVLTYFLHFSHHKTRSLLEDREIRRYAPRCTRNHLESSKFLKIFSSKNKCSFVISYYKSDLFCLRHREDVISWIDTIWFLAIFEVFFGTKMNVQNVLETKKCMLHALF